MASVSFVDGHIDEPSGQKVYKCKYCGNKAMRYSPICSKCAVKLKFVRKLKKMLDAVKKSEAQE